jgi:RNA polymerase sigma-70 factor (ECF subfamily)
MQWMWVEPGAQQESAQRLLGGREAAAADADALVEVLGGLAVAIERQWSPPPVPWSEMVDELMARVDRQGDVSDVVAGVERLHGTELYLALACRRGNKEALRRFEALAITPLGPAIGRIDASAAFVDEVRQRVRAKLLVPLSTGKLSHYAGQGPLATWVRVVAVRDAIDLRRGPAPVAGDDALAAVHHDATSPELGIVKAQYREKFATAFRGALGDLEPAQRNLLRLHYLHGLGVDALAPTLGIHRSNAARRIAKARRSLLSQTRRRLQIELSIGRDDFDQLMTMIASRLDLSIERFMAE